MKKQIILVEDSKDQALLFKNMIEDVSLKFNHEVTVFDRGLEAVEYIKNNQKDISLVILDLMLPDCSGFDLIPEINKLKNKPSVIVLSANDDKDLFIKAIKLGADNYFIKGSSQKELEEFYNAIIKAINKA